MDFFTFEQSPHKERRVRIVKTAVTPHVFSVGVSIAVTAEMGAGIISSDVSTENAAAFRPLRLLLGNIKRTADSCLKCFLSHAAVAVYAIWSEVIALRTGFYRYAVTLSYISKSLANDSTLVLSYWLCLWKVACDLLININEADNAYPCIT